MALKNERSFETTLGGSKLIITCTFSGIGLIPSVDKNMTQ
jgi:hypothetical protein